MQSNNISGHTGVHWHKRKKKWVAQIGDGTRQIFLGYFEDINDAITARQEANERYGFTQRHGLEKPPESDMVTNIDAGA